jgi:hypothetical protein
MRIGGAVGGYREYHLLENTMAADKGGSFNKQGQNVQRQQGKFNKKGQNQQDQQGQQKHKGQKNWPVDEIDEQS